MPKNHNHFIPGTWHRILAGAMMLGLAVAARGQPPPQIPIRFDNLTNGEFSNGEIYVNLLGDDVNFNGTYTNHAGAEIPLQLNQSYSLVDLTSNLPGAAPTIKVSQWNSGRIYFSYGAPLSGLGPGYLPAAADTGDGNYNTRYQYMEATILANIPWADTVHIFTDISYIDFTSTSLSMTGQNVLSGGINLVQTAAAGQTLFNAVTTSGNYGNVLKSNAGPLELPLSRTTNFTRVIGPSLIANPAPLTMPAPFYHEWGNYLTHLNTIGAVMNISGNFQGSGAGTGAQYDAQPYAFHATFDAAGNLTMAAQPGSGAGGIGSNVTITANFTALNAQTGIYGTAPYFVATVDGNVTYSGTGGNDVYFWIMGDLLAGLNFGDAGSATIYNGTVTGFVPTAVGNLTSTQWFEITEGSMASPYLFAGLQSNPDYYNAYAAGLASLTTAYGTQFGDRIGQNTMQFSINSTLNPNAYLAIGLNGDGAVPEPATAALLGGLATGGLALGVVRRRKRAG